MTPLAPVYLLGLAAAGIPLVLHLIYRRRAQKMFFSTVRFLRLSNERTAHRRRFQDLLLLLLRTALFLLLVFALAQFIVKLTGGAGLVNARAALVLVVDNSYSMSVLDGEKERYAAAKEAALAILRRLQSGDEAAALFTSGPERQLEPEFSNDLQAVQGAINRSRSSAEGGNVMVAVREAQRLLLAKDAQAKEIYVLTDLQKRAWETGSRWDEQPETALERERKAEIPIFVFDAGRPVETNLAVREIRVSGHAFVRGTTVAVEADIANPTPLPAAAMVDLFVSGEAQGRRKLDLRANAVGTATFAYELPQSGLADIEVRLPDDLLRIDNRRHFKLEVKEHIRALIVQDTASAVDFLDQSYFLERALDPSIALGGPSASVIRASRVRVKDVDAARLAGHDGVRVVPDGAAAALKEFVHRGGGLIFFAGEELDAAAYSRQFGAGPDPLLSLGLLPFDRGEPDRVHFRQIASVDESHFVFAPFRGLNILKAVRVYKSARIDLHAATPMATLALLTDGQPLVLEHSCGRGKVVFITVSADTSWSNLPVTDLFLPMIHQLVYHVCGSVAETDSLSVGAPYRFRFPEAATPVTITLRRPDGAEETITTRPMPDSNEAVYADTFTPGYYTYTAEGGVSRRGAFVVNPDTSESDLARVSAEELEQHLAPAIVRVSSSIEEMEKLVAPLREGVHLRDLFIVAAIALAVFETVISNWISPRSEADRKPSLATEGAAEEVSGRT